MLSQAGTCLLWDDGKMVTETLRCFIGTGNDAKFLETTYPLMDDNYTRTKKHLISEKVLESGLRGTSSSMWIQL